MTSELERLASQLATLDVEDELVRGEIMREMAEVAQKESETASFVEMLRNYLSSLQPLEVAAAASAITAVCSHLDVRRVIPALSKVAGRTSGAVRQQVLAALCHVPACLSTDSDWQVFEHDVVPWLLSMCDEFDDADLAVHGFQIASDRGWDVAPVVPNLAMLLTRAVERADQILSEMTDDVWVSRPQEVAILTLELLSDAATHRADLAPAVRALQNLFDHPLFQEGAARAVTAWMARQEDWDGLQLLAEYHADEVRKIAKAKLLKGRDEMVEDLSSPELT